MKNIVEHNTLLLTPFRRREGEFQQSTNSTQISGVPEGAQGYAIAEILAGSQAVAAKGELIHVALTDREAKNLAEVLPFFLPDAEIMYFPGWDCLPYDRVSPHPQVVAERTLALAQMQAKNTHKQRVVVTTVSAVLQKLPPREAMKQTHLHLKVGELLDVKQLQEFLSAHGYIRASKAMEAGEYAMRGNIIDLMPPGGNEGYRLDLFGDDIEAIRRFDPMTQISVGREELLELRSMSELLMTDQRIERFRNQYRERFGAVHKQDALYESISQGTKYPGMEHWMPLFYERMETLLDYVPGALVSLGLQVKKAIAERHETIRDYYTARLEAGNIKAVQTAPYHPLPPDYLYIMEQQWAEKLEDTPHAVFSAFAGEGEANTARVALQLKAGVNLAMLRTDHTLNPFKQLREFAVGKRHNKQATLLACLSEGSRERISGLLMQQEAHAVRIDNYINIKNISGNSIGLCVLPLEHGFEAPRFALITEQDVLGERIIRAKPKKRKTEAFFAEASHFTEGELVVHREHGIGRFDGLVTLEIMGAQHDCLKLCYAGDDRLFLPVENIDLLTRFGAEDENAKLDKLGAAAWQSRKARLKERIKLAAEQLIKTAAEREIRHAPHFETSSDAYAEFCSRFPYMETEDQDRAIEDVKEDLSSGHPMDRLICGDVGFGKTEVALRAAFMVAQGEVGDSKEKAMQVALIAPTTLLARQHYKNFRTRFEGFNIKVAQLSRLVNAKDQKLVHEGLKSGEIDIVIGTHALLAKSIEFNRLGLVIVDEEQHFGVAQKEKLKELKHGVHVLTLSATPIPRTLQMALTGVRSLSLITTPPVDRLAVRSFVTPFDPVMLRDAILREKHRGGRVFLVTPRIDDIAELKHKILALVPEIDMCVAHGQMPPAQLDSIMNDFYDGKHDMLLSTAIIESGLDIPTANTMIIHRADRFGLAQLYQLRGRVGRGKVRAYAYFLLPAGKVLAPTATRRLEVMQTLDSLGAGFSLASHDMDIRGFGNLVGEEQSGYIKEVGIELYQQMLAEAVDALRVENAKKQAGVENVEAATPSSDWSPQINLGMSVLIPEYYVQDLQLRLGLYRRAANLRDEAEGEALAAEMVDRFGKLPEEVEHLLSIVRIKQLCRQAGVERIDAGPKGAVLSFHKPWTVSADKLLALIAKNPTRMKLRPDEKLFYAHAWNNAADKTKGLQHLLLQLTQI